MSVLKGEGKVPILFNTTSVAVGPVTRTAYLARPDLAGEWPTVILVASAWGVTSSMKDVCRRLARQGLAVLAPDLYRGRPPDGAADLAAAVAAYDAIEDAVADLELIASFVSNPAGHWSSAEHGLGVLGLGVGGRHAAAASGLGDVLALAYADIREPEGGSILDVVSHLAVPLLGLYGRADERVPVADVLALREAAPHAELVLYDNVGHDFLDDHRQGYDHEAASDAIERLASFFSKHLPSDGLSGAS